MRLTNIEPTSINEFSEAGLCAGAFDASVPKAPKAIALRHGNRMAARAEKMLRNERGKKYERNASSPAAGIGDEKLQKQRVF
jgi:hypothetical protein